MTIQQYFFIRKKYNRVEKSESKNAVHEGWQACPRITILFMKLYYNTPSKKIRIILQLEKQHCEERFLHPCNLVSKNSQLNDMSDIDTEW